MYIVVSKWKIGSDSFVDSGSKARAAMRKEPGVEMVEAFKSEDGHAVAIVTYKDEATYKNIMKEGGAFERIAKENHIEDQGTWLWSERGEAIDHQHAMA